MLGQPGNPPNPPIWGTPFKISDGDIDSGDLKMAPRVDAGLLDDVGPVSSLKAAAVWTDYVPDPYDPEYPVWQVFYNEWSATSTSDQSSTEMALTDDQPGRLNAGPTIDIAPDSTNCTGYLNHQAVVAWTHARYDEQNQDYTDEAVAFVVRPDWANWTVTDIYAVVPDVSCYQIAATNQTDEWFGLAYYSRASE